MATDTKTDTIVNVHGLRMASRSRETWVDHSTRRGSRVITLCQPNLAIAPLRTGFRRLGLSRPPGRRLIDPPAGRVW